MSRKKHLVAIRECLGNPESRDDQENMLEALLLTAATLANAMSDNSVDYSRGHVKEAADQMLEVLDQTFDLNT
ncbi:MAG: hypothetical protein MI757_03315 [Pirellulales bacterium]|nr:hypothetical protein [Pirellulales bacterium]